MLVENFVARNNKVEDLKLRVTILESAVARDPEPQKECASKVHVPKPQHFKEMRDEKEVETSCGRWSATSRRYGYMISRRRSRSYPYTSSMTLCCSGIGNR